MRYLCLFLEPTYRIPEPDLIEEDLADAIQANSPQEAAERFVLQECTNSSDFEPIQFVLVADDRAVLVWRLYQVALTITAQSTELDAKKEAA